MTLSTAHATDTWSAKGGWYLVCAYCAWETIALTLSTLYSFAQPVVQEKYGVGNVQIVTLGQSMQIMGNMLGVSLLSPLSDVFGRRQVTILSMLAYSCLNLGTAYAPNLPTLIFFMFLSGAAWSTSLSLVPAVFSDLYLHRDDIGQPIALFVIGASVGPTLGGVIATALMDAGADLKWYFLVAVFVSAACAVPMSFVPESLNAARVGEIKDSMAAVPVLQSKLDAGPTHGPGQTRHSGWYFVTRVWYLLATEPIMWITGIYNGLANGVFVLTVGGSITTLTEFKGLALMDAATSIIFMAIGVVLVWFVMPIQTRLYREDKARHHGRALPESRLLLIQDVIWMFPVALAWSAFTGGEAWGKWHQAVTGGVVAFTDSFLYQCLLIYILDLYPEEAASATAAWLIPCFPVQAAAVHFGVPLFQKLGPEWAFGLLAVFTAGFVVPGFYAIMRFGPRMRGSSPTTKKGFRL
ncbi:vitamin b6 transporter bsu1 [Colletotrichum phormii]|uniref:Vitamin b6 transporter bsu1 n=1 Tax=Colletotrichum phormii TaxID=359342 RepID=A0AAI9ZS54_9PEZI|nr:vitamin b6 transporter bsu1 [Colletotrichum phormii]KAK1637093.1 vitamin b6 transporter bsu1 [Colletotrichum phormii]